MFDLGLWGSALACQDERSPALVVDGIDRESRMHHQLLHLLVVAVHRSSMQVQARVGVARCVVIEVKLALCWRLAARVARMAPCTPRTIAKDVESRGRVQRGLRRELCTFVVKAFCKLLPLLVPSYATLVPGIESRRLEQSGESTSIGNPSLSKWSGSKTRILRTRHRRGRG